MKLDELIKRSRASRRSNYVAVDLETICLKVKHMPGHSAYWHYGCSLSRSRYYAAFERAEGHGLIVNKGKKIAAYYITQLGIEFLDKYNQD